MPRPHKTEAMEASQQQSTPELEVQRGSSSCKERRHQKHILSFSHRMPRTSENEKKNKKKTSFTAYESLMNKLTAHPKEQSQLTKFVATTRYVKSARRGR